MRQLTKSALSLGWALSLLGAKQAYGVVSKGQFDQGDILGPVTQAAVGQLDDFMKRIHRSAESMESRAVDMAFSLMNPARWLSGQAGNAGNAATESGQRDATQQSRSAGTGIRSGDNCSGKDNTFSGWGPMPRH
jgi:hypothetical protein